MWYTFRDVVDITFASKYGTPIKKSSGGRRVRLCHHSHTHTPRKLSCFVLFASSLLVKPSAHFTIHELENRPLPISHTVHPPFENYVVQVNQTMSLVIWTCAELLNMSCYEKPLIILFSHATH